MQSKECLRKDPVYTVSFIGYSGSSTEHVSVGKSCLIHRYLSHTPYSEDHLSVISRSDFDSEVVGGSHWLHWGDCGVETSNLCGRLRIIEQCDFLDDLLYSPMSSSLPYAERCLEKEITVNSRKLAYICKNQLGDESSFPRVYMNAGIIHVSAFVFAYDITLDGSSAFHQASFLQRTLKELSKSNTPLVLVTTKHDSEWSSIARRLLALSLNEKIKSRWLERRFRLVETSARSNVNVEEVFRSAFLLASGKTMPKSHKSTNGYLEQRMKGLSIRLRKPLQLQYVQCKPDNAQVTHIPSKIRTIIDEASESYRTACMSHLHNGHTNRSSSVAPSSLPFPREPVEKHSALCTNAPYPAIPLQHLSCRGALPPHRTPLDDTCSVLPTPPPPPLLLPGPGSPGLFGPIATPSFFASSAATRTESNARTAVLVDSAASYPLTRIYLYGSEELVNSVMWALRSVCPLDRFRAKDGSFHRVWILAGSLGDWEFRSPPESDQSGEPSLSTTDTTALMSSPTDRRALGTSHMSAFSAPVVSPSDDAPESSYNSGHGTAKSMHSSEPTSRSTQSTDLGEVNGSGPGRCTQSTMQFVLRVLVYESVSQMNELARTMTSEGSSNARSDTSQMNALLCWTASRDPPLVTSLIANGLVVASRMRIPLLSADGVCGTGSLLGFLLDLVSRDVSPNSEPVHPGSTESPKDWTSFSPAHCLPVVGHLMGLEFPRVSAAHSCGSDTIFGCAQLLAALVPLTTSTTQSVTSGVDFCAKGPTRRPLFLPPTVTAPTAVKPEPNLLESSAIAGPFARFVSLDQISTVLRSRMPSSGIGCALIVHYLAARWRGLQSLLRDHLERLLGQLSSEEVSSSVRISSIILVAVHNPRAKEHTAEVWTGLQAGMQYAQQLANAYNCSFRVLNPVKSANEGGENDSFHAMTTDIAMPYSVASVDNSWVPLQLLFLSLSVENHFECWLHEKVLSGDSYLMSHVPDSIPEGDVEHVALTSAPRQPLSPSNTCGTASSSLQQPAFTSTVARSGHTGFPARSSTADFPVQSPCLPPGTNFVELPWLPLSSSRNWCFRPQVASTCVSVPPSTANSNLTVGRGNLLTPVPSTSYGVQPSWNAASNSTTQNGKTQGAPVGSMCESTLTVLRNSGEPTSSVEEYYAELPKIAQSEVRGLDRCIRRLNRPKRPRPRTSSTNSHSSSSPPSPATLPSPLCPTAVAACRGSSNPTNRVSRLATLPLTSGADENNDINGDDNDDYDGEETQNEEKAVSRGLSLTEQLDCEAAVYAEVNDALLPESRCSYPPALIRAHDLAPTTGPYDTPYAMYGQSPACLSSDHRRFSRSIPTVQPVQTPHCVVRIADCDKHTLTPPFVSRPLPTIVDCDSSPSTHCSSCRIHNSPRTSDTSLPSCHPHGSDSVQPNNPALPRPHTQQCTRGTNPNPSASNSTPDTNGASQKSARPPLSSLNDLSAAIRRHGVWFRHSISWRTRKQRT